MLLKIALSGIETPKAKSNMNRPNILWYCTDQQRFDTIGALGNPYVRTPTLDTLVKKGVSFRNAYCQSPICTPSRTSIMTGLYPSKARSTRNGNETFPTETPLISRLIADSGYDCGLIGKFHLSSAGKRPEPRLNDGFSYWKHSHAPRDDWPIGSHSYADWVRSQGIELKQLQRSGKPIPPKFHQTKWASDCAIEFIKKRRTNPWILNINVYDPHPPFTPPTEYSKLFDAKQMPGPYFKESDLEHQRSLNGVDFQGEALEPSKHDAKQAQANYYAMIMQIDDQLSRILKALNNSGQIENTVIIYTSDHGEMLGDHGLMFKGCRFYEGLVKVPLIISFPRLFKTNLQVDGLVELLDLSATLLSLAGTEIPNEHQGCDLTPILKGLVPGDHIRSSVRCEYFDSLDSAFTGGGGSYGTMFRDEQYKLVVYHDKGLGELYDLKEDPWEFNDLWNDERYYEIKNRLIFESFNSHVILTTNVGSKRIAPM